MEETMKAAAVKILSVLCVLWGKEGMMAKTAVKKQFFCDTTTSIRIFMVWLRPRVF